MQNAEALALLKQLGVKNNGLLCISWKSGLQNEIIDRACVTAPVGIYVRKQPLNQNHCFSFVGGWGWVKRSYSNIQKIIINKFHGGNTQEEAGYLYNLTRARCRKKKIIIIMETKTVGNENHRNPYFLTSWWYIDDQMVALTWTDFMWFTINKLTELH